MKLFISPRSAQSAARSAMKPGWSFEIVTKRTFNRDKTCDVGFGAKFFDQHGLPAGVLR